MNEFHKVYLNLGSNIEPPKNIRMAVELLKDHGRVLNASALWESQDVSSSGPNFLNACVLFSTTLQAGELKDQILKPIEFEMGRIRSEDKNAPRTIDIDIVMFDNVPLNLRQWEYIFVIVPLAELIPSFSHPIHLKKLSSLSEELQNQTWIKRCDDAPIF